jgi:predicted nucleic acid-binding Zn ribbon protein
MPIYELECKSCGHVNEIIIGISELDARDADDMDLKDIGISCAKCKAHTFTKKISAHGKTAHNWSSWRRAKGSVG